MRSQGTYRERMGLDGLEEPSIFQTWDWWDVPWDPKAQWDIPEYPMAKADNPHSRHIHLAA